MRKIRTLVLVAVASLCGTAYAQVDNSLQFEDKNGNVIPDGSTITIDEVEFVDDGMDGYYQINSGLFVRNNKAEKVGAGLVYTISRIDNGTLNSCYPAVCPVPAPSAPGTYSAARNGVLEPNELKNFQTEWILAGKDAFGECTATFKLEVREYSLNGIGVPTPGELIAYGPSVTINFVNKSSAGINDTSTSESKTIVARYTADGRKLDAPAKGLNIVKYSDGTAAKVVVR